MLEESELRRLLSLVVYRATLDIVDGLDPFRHLLEGDDAGAVVDFLNREMQGLQGREQGGVAFVLAEYHRRQGDVQSVRRLFAIDDAEIKGSVLNALWEPGPNSAMAGCILALATEAARHPSPAVRTEACYVFMNQCAYVDVSETIADLQSLLGDDVARVRMQAAYAAGNLAKHKFDVSRLVTSLGAIVNDGDRFARCAGAWALWQLSRAKRDIALALPDLVRLLITDQDEWDEPRKNAAGALIHHARKSAVATTQVRDCVSAIPPPASRKTVKRFLEQLAALK